jgi:RNA polymerase sigma-70 factor (ECF subfamily)
MGNAPALSPGEAALGEELTALYREHGAFVWRSLRHLGVPPADLDDALQEVFLVVLRKHDTWDRMSSIRSWLFGIARMISMNMRKRAHVRRERPVASPPEEIALSHPEGLVSEARAFA